MLELKRLRLAQPFLFLFLFVKFLFKVSLK